MAMERDRSTLLVALFALPKPPNGVLVKQRSSSEEAEVQALAVGPSSCGRHGRVEAGACTSRLNRLDDETRTRQGVLDGSSCGRHGRVDSGACTSRLNRLDDETRTRQGVLDGSSCGRHGRVDSGACTSRLNRLDDETRTRQGDAGVGVASEPMLDGSSCGRHGRVEAGACTSRLNRLDDETQTGQGDADVASEGIFDGSSRSRPGRGKLDACLIPLGADAARPGKGRARSRRSKGTTVVDSYGRRAREEPPCGGYALQSTKLDSHLVASREDRGKLDRCGEEPTSPSNDDHGVTVSGDLVLEQRLLGHDPVGREFARTGSHVQLLESYYDPSHEILQCHGKVLSEWRPIWEKTPLVLHDKNLVKCLTRNSELYDLTAFISSLLELHPGPVQLFRLDSSKWTGREYQLSKWLELLSGKNVMEIVLVNRQKTDMEFPFSSIESNCLDCLRLCFFSLSQLDLNCFDYGLLTTLQLIGCTFLTIRLYCVVKECKSLTHLEIGISDSDIRISSSSLKFLQVWRCKMRHFTIESAPNLNKMVLGLRPKDKSVHVTVRETQLLQECHYLLLPYHVFENKSWLKTLRKVQLGLEMGNSLQRLLLSQCIEQASSLQELYLWRMDEISISEELDVVIDNSLSRLSCGQVPLSNLENLVMEDFRGGGSELALASAIMKYSIRLKTVSLCAYAHSSQDLIRKAVRELQSREKASLPRIVGNLFQAPTIKSYI